MTACTNHGGKARRVVTAALVGVLSVGTVPMVALAEGVSDGIETLAQNWATDAEITSATDGKGAVAGTKDVTFTLGSGKYLVPTAVDGVALDEDYYVEYTIPTDGSSDPVNHCWNGLVPGGSYLIDGKGSPVTIGSGSTVTVSAEFARSYFTGTLTDASGTPQKVNPIKGAFTVTVRKVGETGSVSADFKLVDPTTDVTYSLYDKLGGTSDTTLTYTGGEWLSSSNTGNIGVVDSDGNAYVVTSIANIHTPDGKACTSVVDAGNYVADFTFTRTEGTSTVTKTETISFAIEKLDLSTAALTIADKQVPGYADGDALLSVIEFNGRTPARGIMKVSEVEGPGSYGFTTPGEYTATIVSDDNDNVTGSASVTFTVYNNNVATSVRYGRSTVDNGTSPLEIWLEDGDSFDASKIKVEGTLDGDSVSYTGDQLEVTYVDKATGEQVDASALANKGHYTAHVRVIPFQDFKTDKWQGGSIDFDIDVYATSLDADKAAGFYLDGELAGNGSTVVYDGTDQLDKLEVVVKDSDGNVMEQGTDYDLKVTNSSKKTVDEAVDADTYYVSIEAKTFEFTSGVSTFKLTVNPITVVANGLKDYTDAAYTGSALDVPAAYMVLDAAGVPVTEGGEYVYAELPSDVYNVVSIKKNGKTVSEIKDADEDYPYVVKIALSDEAKGNYILHDSEFEVTVKEYGHFTDVKAEAWYAQVVEQAYNELYVNGIANTNLYAPEAQITRADVACILYNMAGGTNAQIGDKEFGFSENTGYITGFDDVDGHAYYAQAIAWAHASGVVNGHEGNFRPTDKITREEFASMLANFAKVKGDYKAASDDALAGMPDASGVSAWAEANVAWAVENGVMGNGGYVKAQDKITRAEVAAMAVNYQPENLTGLTRADIA